MIWKQRDVREGCCSLSLLDICTSKISNPSLFPLMGEMIQALITFTLWGATQEGDDYEQTKRSTAVMLQFQPPRLLFIGGKNKNKKIGRLESLYLEFPPL